MTADTQFPFTTGRDRVPGAVAWNLFDIDAKFADVLSVDDCVAYLNRVNRANAPET